MQEIYRGNEIEKTMLEWLSELLNQVSSVTFWVEIFSAFRGLGPIAPILLALIESIVPALPLMMIVTFNIGAYGAFWGFVFSWIGNVLGSILVFLFFRFVIKKLVLNWLIKYPPIDKGLQFVAKANQSILFLVAIFPFTPSSILNVCFGLSDFDKKTYIITIASAKMFMIFFLTLFGNSFMMAFENPIYFVVSIALLGLLMWISRYFSKKSGL